MNHLPALNELDAFLLLVLAQKASYGYELARLAAEEFPGKNLNNSKIYYSLDKLQKAGLTLARRKSAHMAPDRIMHRTSRQGKQALGIFLSQQVSHTEATSHRLLRSFRRNQARLSRYQTLMRLLPSDNLSHKPRPRAF